MKNRAIATMLILVFCVAVGGMALLKWGIGGATNDANTNEASQTDIETEQPQDVPDGYEQLLPRGGIPAIDDPEYVSADEATIADSSYVLGLVVEGQARAYSLNLLNAHEIVNDTIGKTNFAAVW